MSRDGESLSREELLAHAARCYRSASLDQDACRCYESALMHGQAAILHRTACRWHAAARCFEADKQWESAARCHLENNNPEEAARCFLVADDPLEAAWTLAHHARNYDGARIILADLSFESTERQLALGLARGRCAAPRNAAEAGRAVRRAIQGFPETIPGRDRNRVIAWAMTLAHDVLDRPDLVSALFSAMAEVGVEDARTHWERWAQARLGSAEGIFTAEEEQA